MKDSRSALRFGVFELDPKAGELRKKGMKVRLQGQPIDILVLLLQRPGEIVTREELQKDLWPADTFVDFEQGLNNAMKRLRAALDDDAESPHFIETLPRRGYRFIAPVESAGIGNLPVEALNEVVPKHAPKRAWTLRVAILFGGCVLVLGTGFYLYKLRKVSESLRQRTLTRVTFDDGLQIGATWSPDSRYIAFSSFRFGKSEIWVRQVAGGDPVQITRGPANNWQPDWSPDGKYIAYRSEDGDGGLFIVPALGGAGMQRKITSFGVRPHWSPDGRRILFQTIGFGLNSRVYVVDVDGGSPPRQILSDITLQMPVGKTAWHPDGKRVSFTTWSHDPSPIPNFWTGPVDSAETAVRTELTPDLVRMAESAAGSGISAWADTDYKFAWAPSGRAIYFERSLRGAKNIWRLTVDPKSLRATGIERLTTGTGLESELALSPDGTKLAFTSESEQVRAWMFPFDSIHGRATGSGAAATSPGLEAWEGSLSKDNRKFAFSSKRAGKWELWQKSFADGSETRIAPEDGFVRDEPQWSPDGSRLAYVRRKSSTGEMQAVIWESEPKGELEVTPFSHRSIYVSDWSPDGEWLLASWDKEQTEQAEIWKLPTPGSRNSEIRKKIVPCDTNQNLWQARFSPDGSWIVFQGITHKLDRDESAIYVVPANGGSWTRITTGTHWDDKPRWSPDGKSIYFISERGGFFNVFGVRFDPAGGKPVGDTFQITQFHDPSLMMAKSVPKLGLSITQNRLVVTVSQSSGNIWVLDNLDH